MGIARPRRRLTSSFLKHLSPPNVPAALISGNYGAQKAPSNNPHWLTHAPPSPASTMVRPSEQVSVRRPGPNRAGRRLVSCAGLLFQVSPHYSNSIVNRPSRRDGPPASWAAHRSSLFLRPRLNHAIQLIGVKVFFFQLFRIP